MKSALIAKAGPVASILTALLLTAGGCASKPKPTNASASVLDVSSSSKSPYGAADANYAPPTPYAGSLANYPAQAPTGSGYGAAPVPTEPAITQTPSYNPAPAGPSAGGSYTVKKGDTFFRIARERYGDGKQWQRIAAANPGVSPSSLKVGQKIVVP